jgi:hypothetical protein
VPVPVWQRTTRSTSSLRHWLGWSSCPEKADARTLLLILL